VVLRGHERTIRALAIPRDGRWLLTGSDDETIRLWHLRFDELIALACRTAGRNLTAQEWQQYFGAEAHRKTCLQFP
jgi:WD40 repeat protein